MAGRPTELVTVKISEIKPDVMKRRLKELGLDSSGDAKDLVRRLISDVRKKIANKIIPAGKAGQCDVCGGFSDLRNPECPYCGTVDNEKDDNPAAANKKKSGSAKQKRSDIVKPTEKPAAPKQTETALAKKYVEKDLNESIVAIGAAKARAGEGLYALGKELAKVHDLELWKLRKGNPYKSFKVFCVKEIGMSDRQAFKYMSVSSAYTEEQLSKFGITKCAIALTVPDEVRGGLLGDGSESERDMSERARKLVDGEQRARKTPPASDREKAVTVAIVPGIVEVVMQKRPKQDDWPAGKLTEPATAISDDPWFRLGLTNNVFLSVRLTRNEQGHFVAIVEHRREEEAS